MFCLSKTKHLQINIFIGYGLDCLQSAFSLKIRLGLILASAIANNDVMLQ